MVSLKNDIRFTNKVSNDLEKELANSSYSSVFVLTDSNTVNYCLPIIRDQLPENATVITVPAGESNKTITTCENIWQVLTDGNADRHALLINLGGGVICDMGGFCARTYKRGIDFWNIPTTVLSQVDASVGGKLGVDFGKYKNHIGLFSEPDIVFIDPVFFETLPEDEVVSGFAEMIKHALIRNPEGFEKLAGEDAGTIDWSAWIPGSVEIKKEVVEADPTENGLRKILNFGHTIGHAIESYFLDTSQPLKHGEAIALGMIAESYLSQSKLGLPEDEFNRIAACLAKQFPMPMIPGESLESIASLAIQDKKNKDGIINAVLLNKIGSPEIDVPITRSEIIDALTAYNKEFAK